MRKTITALLMLLLFSLVSFAHRLNEYLQATTISLSRQGIMVQMRLTPGTDVAPAFLKVIDVDNDGLISSKEQLYYCAKLTRDVDFILNKDTIAAKPVITSFPAVKEIRLGVGEIVVNYQIPINGSVINRLEIRNHHFKTIAVYLVNCLLPADGGIKVLNQARSIDQYDYTLDFSLNKYQGLKTPDKNFETTNGAVTSTYILHGIKHILSGYDHLLFLCALVLGAVGLWDLVKVVTAFTVAHSITLTLAVYGLVHVPEQIVEPVIAASIVFVAIQNITRAESTNSYSRLAIAFFFGLFHGLGFAGGLLQIMHAMPNNLVIAAILGFSAGVEIGNQLVLLPFYGLLQWQNRRMLRRGDSKRFMTFKKYISGAVAFAGAIYFISALHAAFQNI